MLHASCYFLETTKAEALKDPPYVRDFFCGCIEHVTRMFGPPVVHCFFSTKYFLRFACEAPLPERNAQDLEASLMFTPCRAQGLQQ